MYIRVVVTEGQAKEMGKCATRKSSFFGGHKLLDSETKKTNAATRRRWHAVCMLEELNKRGSSRQRKEKDKKASRILNDKSFCFEEQGDKGNKRESSIC
mmetsp:Transcript_87277/g.151869  ORF Transcript_87277/g.151869 Transcript_87277/m.151869 type:complete len:99 (+) Transcript_87277:958-1254(+)